MSVLLQELPSLRSGEIGLGGRPSAGADGLFQPKADQPLAEPRGPVILIRHNNMSRSSSIGRFPFFGSGPQRPKPERDEGERDVRPWASDVHPVEYYPRLR